MFCKVLNTSLEPLSRATVDGCLRQKINKLNFFFAFALIPKKTFQGLHRFIKLIRLNQ